MAVRAPLHHVSLQQCSLAMCVHFPHAHTCGMFFVLCTASSVHVLRRAIEGKGRKYCMLRSSCRLACMVVDATLHCTSNHVHFERIRSVAHVARCLSNVTTCSSALALYALQGSGGSQFARDITARAWDCAAQPDKSVSVFMHLHICVPYHG